MNLICLAGILLLARELNAMASCPSDQGYNRTAFRHRLANGRFYIFHAFNRRQSTFYTWDEAFWLCRRHNLTLARVNHLTTFWHIVNNWRTNPLSKYKDTWYWMAAKYDPIAEEYKWFSLPNETTNESLAYTNYYYRTPKPIGLGVHTTHDFLAQPDRIIPQCVTFAIPWPLDQGFEYYGYNPTMDERACESKQRRHVMCEASMDCNAPDPGPYTLSEGKENYFDEGNFIFGNRMYIVNWGQRDFPDSVKYCEDLGLELYNPGESDHCLIPYLKLWARNVSTSQWWTQWSYRQANWTVLDGVGKHVTHYDSNQGFHTARIRPGYFNWTENDDIEGRSNVNDEFVCVGLSHHFELKVQMHCPNQTNHLCQWHFLTYAPSNCNNRQGVICQHKDIRENPKRTCSWMANWIKPNRLYEGVKASALIPFGFERNRQYFRSTYKQTFGSLYCGGMGYSMVRERNIVWWNEVPKELTEEEMFKYDYRETYWVVDKEKFQKPPGSNCTISKFIKEGKRNTFKVPCTEWHFYLCKKFFKPPLTHVPGHPDGYKEPEWNWNSQDPTPRIYSF